MEQSIRDVINSGNHIFYNKYFKDKWAYWNKLCSAMDVIGDTSLAIESFLGEGVGNENGNKYLRIYGVLQGIYLQQDAVVGIYDVVKHIALDYKIIIKKIEDYSRVNWLEIRKYRNLSIGHPIECSSHEKGEINRAFISRVTISDKGFQLLLNRDKQKNTRFEYVNINSLITGYKKEAEVMLKDLQSVLIEISKILRGNNIGD